MRPAIVTRYHGPTDHKGSRIKATSSIGSTTISYEPALNAEQNHRAAARELVRKLGLPWEPFWHGGETPDGRGYVYVCSEGVSL